MEVNTYLEEVFGEKIILKDLNNTKGIPQYLLENYDFYHCVIQNENYTFLFVKNKNIVIHQIRKQLDKMKSLDYKKPVLILDHTRRETRNKLIANKIPFIDSNRQMYIPYICLSIDDTIHVNGTEINHFTPSTQLIFIAILMQNDSEIHSGQMQKKYHINAMTLSRSLRDLKKIGVLTEEGYNTRKKYRRIEKAEYWRIGKSYMVNPIQKKIYVKNLVEQKDLLLSGDSALSYYTMLSEPSKITYAIHKDKLQFIDKESIIDEDIALNEECFQIEVWNYNPQLLAINQQYIDIYSLYAQFQDNHDPRVEIALEELLEREKV